MSSFRYVIVFAALFWIKPGAARPSPTPPAPGPSAARLGSPWAAVLPALNQDPSQVKLKPPFSQALSSDLLQLHAEEMKEISRQVESAVGGSKEFRSSRNRARVNQLIHSAVQALNQQTFATVRQSAASHQQLNKDYFEPARRIITAVQSNPVANPTASPQYDDSGQIGFCFGRALLAHHLLLKAGVPQSDLAKIFVFGELMVRRQLWQFHVAVMVRDSKHGFLVVDPLLTEPQPLDKWIEATKAFDLKGQLSRARFFVTDPRKFLPAFGMYHPDQLEDPHLRRFFDDLWGSLTP